MGDWAWDAGQSFQTVWVYTELAHPKSLPKILTRVLTSYNMQPGPVMQPAGWPGGSRLQVTNRTPFNTLQAPTRHTFSGDGLLQLHWTHGTSTRPPPPTTPRVCADDPVQTPCTVGSLKGRPSQPGGLSGSPGPFAHGGTGSGLRNGLWSPCLRLLRGPADPSLTNLGAVLRVQDKNRKQTTGSVSNSRRIQNTSMFLGCFLNAFLHHILILVLESARLWFKNLPP